MKKRKRLLGIVISISLLLSFGINGIIENDNFSLLLKNIEAMATNETSGPVLIGSCFSSLAFSVECHVDCICGRSYYPTPRVPHACAEHVTGRCICGNTIFPQ